MDDAIKRLQEQASRARLVAHKARSQKNRERSSTNPHAVNLGHNADVGMDILRLLDGSIRYATPQTNGARGVNEPVLMHQGQGVTRTDSSPHIARKPQPKPPLTPKNKSHFKILFSIIEGNIQKFYVGGDRVQPLLIFEIDTDIYKGEWYAPGEYPGGYTYTNGQYEYHQPYINGYIANIGAKLNDWVVGIRFYKSVDFRFLDDDGDDIHYLAIIKPASPTYNYDFVNEPGISYPIDKVAFSMYSDYETLGIGNLEWKGGGLWTSSMSKMMYVSNWFYYHEIDFQVTIKHNQETYPDNPPTLTVVNPEQWDFNTNPDTPPFSVVQNYLFNESDHTGIRNLVNEVSFNSNEVYNYSSMQGNSSMYLPPTGSYQVGELQNPDSTWQYSKNIYKNFPYSWDLYTYHDSCEYTHDCDSGVTNYSNSQTPKAAFLSAEQFHWEADGGRPYLVIDSANVKHSFNYKYTATEGYCSGFRMSNVQVYSSTNVSIDSFVEYHRHLTILEIEGKNYLLPEKFLSQIAYSKIWVNHVGTTSADRPLRDKPSENRRSYEEAIAANADLTVCLGKRVLIDREEPATFPWYDGIFPDSTEYFIYNGSVAVRVDGSVGFDHYTDTFVKEGNGYKRVYLEAVPEELKTTNVKLHPKVDKFVFDTDHYNIVTSNNKPIRTFSLGIDITKKHFIHNLSYCSGNG